MKTFVITVILIFAFAGISFGWGSRGGDHSSNGNYSYNSNGKWVATSDKNNSTINGSVVNGGPVQVPEPTTLLLLILGGGLAGLYGYRKIKK